MNNRSYLVGYYGMRNTGDDALMLATAWGANTFLGSSEFIVNSPRTVRLPGEQVLPATLAEVQGIRGENRLRQYANALRSNTVIFGGGSVLHSSQDIAIKRHLIKLSGNKQALALGVGVGPFKDNRAEKLCTKFLNECEFVGVRDQQSLDIAKAIAPAANVKLTFDLAPLLTLNKHYTAERNERVGIAICLCPNERLSGGMSDEVSRLNVLAEALTRIYIETGRKVTLIDFNGHDSELGDNKVHQELKWRLPEVLVKEHLYYNENPLQVLKRLAGFELVIGMRLHAAILAYLAETPVIPLNYHSKCAGWCEQIGISEDYIFDSRQFDPQHLVNEATSILSGNYKQPTLTTAKATELALNNWRFQNASEKNEDFGGYSAIQQVSKYFINSEQRNRSSRSAS
ncbi:Polysaccharide pyruvyl transferase family protein WcaK [Alteromonadaceae bacterium Bs31]|nr:Polysaccharide pyruvyl transferase family protein WcaK [Alteromonadaceae bacterium Bs31]